MILNKVKEELLKVSKIAGSQYNDVLITADYYAIRIPHLRKITNNISNDDYKEFLDTNDFQPFELELIHAFVLGKIKDLKTSLYYTDLFVPVIHDWSVNDALCSSLKITRKYLKEYWELLMKYSESEHEFEQRFVAVMLLCHYLNDEYIDKVITVLDSLRNPGYYCKMGVAWAYATIMAKYPEKCFTYLRKNSLDKWTHNKAIQKMIESFRVLDENKQILRKMKR